MKICILGDTHFGMRGDSEEYLNHCQQFYDNLFFKYLKDHNISEIIQLGDFFDNRRAINTNTLKRTKEMFLDKLKCFNLKMTVLLGNHDVYYKNTNRVNSIEELLSNYNNITIINSPSDKKINGLKLCIIPWINKDNYESTMNHLDLTDSEIVLGHFEFANFPMYRGSINTHGMNPSLFKKFKKVLSGHFHTRSKEGNIEYVGTPMEMNWQDCNDPRGFAILDTDTLEVEYIDNPYNMFVKLHYDENNLPDISDLENKEVKLYVAGRTNQKKYDKFIESINERSPAKFEIIEDLEQYLSESEENIELKDTLSLIESYIDELETDNKPEIKKYMQKIYLETLDTGND